MGWRGAQLPVIALRLIGEMITEGGGLSPRIYGPVTSLPLTNSSQDPPHIVVPVSSLMGVGGGWRVDGERKRCM